MPSVWHAVPENLAVTNTSGARKLSLTGGTAKSFGRYVVEHGIPGVSYRITCEHSTHGLLRCGVFTVPGEVVL